MNNTLLSVSRLQLTDVRWGIDLSGRSDDGMIVVDAPTVSGSLLPMFESCNLTEDVRLTVHLFENAELLDTVWVGHSCLPMEDAALLGDSVTVSGSWLPLAEATRLSEIATVSGSRLPMEDVAQLANIVTLNGSLLLSDAAQLTETLKVVIVFPTSTAHLADSTALSGSWLTVGIPFVSAFGLTDAGTATIQARVTDTHNLVDTLAANLHIHLSDVLIMTDLLDDQTTIRSYTSIMDTLSLVVQLYAVDTTSMTDTVRSTVQAMIVETVGFVETIRVAYRVPEILSLTDSVGVQFKLDADLLTVVDSVDFVNDNPPEMTSLTDTLHAAMRVGIPNDSAVLAETLTGNLVGASVFGCAPIGGALCG